MKMPHLELKSKLPFFCFVLGKVKIELTKKLPEILGDFSCENGYPPLTVMLFHFISVRARCKNVLTQRMQVFTN